MVNQTMTVMVNSYGADTTVVTPAAYACDVSSTAVFVLTCVFLLFLCSTSLFLYVLTCVLLLFLCGTSLFLYVAYIFCCLT